MINFTVLFLLVIIVFLCVNLYYVLLALRKILEDLEHLKNYAETNQTNVCSLIDYIHKVVFGGDNDDYKK